MLKALALVETIIFTLAIGCFLMGVSQIILVGFAGSYWLFMLTFILLMIYQRRKSAEKEKIEQQEQENQSSKTTTKNRSKK